MTPLPWAAEPDDREGMEWNVHIVEAARPHMRVAFTSNGPDSEANAAFIVKAVNNHDMLVKAIQDIKQATIEGRVCDDVAWFDTITTLHDFCEQTLAIVTGADLIEAPEPVAWAILHVNCDGIWKLTDDKDSADYWERSGFPVQPLAPLSLSRPQLGSNASSPAEAAPSPRLPE